MDSFNNEPAFRFTERPDPSWTLGEGLKTSSGDIQTQWKEDEKLGWTSYDMQKLEKPLAYKLLTSAVTPRPIAFVSTISEDGIYNLAPFSYFSMVAHDPPLISVSFTLSERRPKDTRENIKATRQFVVNIISEPFVEAANSCSVEAPADIDEWVVSGLTQEPSTFVKPPRVRESAVSLECELYHFLDIPSQTNPGTITTSLVVGQIKHAHVRNAVLTSDGTAVDPTRLRAISRLGGIIYVRVGEGFEIPRPSWREIGGKVREMMEKSKTKDNATAEKENGAAVTPQDKL